MSDEYWIISVPGDGKSPAKKRYDDVCQATGRDQLSQNFIFNIPELKVQRAVDEETRSYPLLVY